MTNQDRNQNQDRDDHLAPEEKAQGQAGKNADDQNRKQKEDKQNKEDGKSQSGRN